MSLRYPHILIILPLPGPWDAALRLGAGFSGWTDAKKVSVLAGLPEHPYPEELIKQYLADPTWEDDARTALDGALGESFPLEKGIERHVEMVTGDLVTGSLRAARALQPDLAIVALPVSKQGRVLGMKLARKLPCSVLLVPSGASAELDRLLTATDFSQSSGQAAETACRLAEATGLQEVPCVHSYPPPGGSELAISNEDFAQLQRKHAEMRFAEFASTVECGSVVLQPAYMEAFSAEHAIIDAAKRNHAKLLVIGAKGKNALAVFFLGSTTEELVRQADLPLLIVKEKGATAGVLDYLLGKMD